MGDGFGAAPVDPVPPPPVVVVVAAALDAAVDAPDDWFKRCMTTPPPPGALLPNPVAVCVTVPPPALIPALLVLVDTRSDDTWSDPRLPVSALFEGLAYPAMVPLLRLRRIDNRPSTVEEDALLLMVLAVDDAALTLLTVLAPAPPVAPLPLALLLLLLLLLLLVVLLGRVA